MRTLERSLIPAWLGVAALVLAGCSNGGSASPASHVPRGDVITLTGYAKTAPDDPTGTATSIRITPAELARIQRSIDSLTPAGAPMCMENERLFSVTVRTPGSSSESYDASAWLCPAPGVVIVRGVHAQRSYGVSCALLRLAASYLPPGRAAPCRYFPS
jgi:hypothetical protein